VLSKQIMRCRGFLSGVSPATFVLLTAAVFSACMGAGAAELIEVHSSAALRIAIQELRPETTIRLASGEYGNEYYVRNARGLTIEPLDPANPPTFSGGKVAWQFSRCPGLTVRSIVLRGQTENGLNLDDGGQSPLVQETLLESIHVFEIGPTGNHDGIKCSGLDTLTIKNCKIVAWGGQGIDLVGCHNVQIEDCVFEGKAGFSATAGIQIKGGSSHVTVGQCRFVNAGERPINAGGSTGTPYFRPREATSEASNIIIRGNEIRGGLCAVAFVGVDNAVFEENTILFPSRWLMRILQENQRPEMVPCRNVLIRRNEFVFRRQDLREAINIGPGTAASTFQFSENAWFAEDQPHRSVPSLPSREVDGRYGIDPRTE